MTFSTQQYPLELYAGNKFHSMATDGGHVLKQQIRRHCACSAATKYLEDVAVNLTVSHVSEPKYLQGCLDRGHADLSLHKLRESFPCRLNACGSLSLLYALVFTLICLRILNFFLFFFFLSQNAELLTSWISSQKKKKSCWMSRFALASSRGCCTAHNIAASLATDYGRDFYWSKLCSKRWGAIVSFAWHVYMFNTAHWLNFDKCCLPGEQLSTLCTLFIPVIIVPNYSCIQIFLPLFCWFNVFCLSLHSSNLTRTLIDNISSYIPINPPWFRFSMMHLCHCLLVGSLLSMSLPFLASSQTCPGAGIPGMPGEYKNTNTCSLYCFGWSSSSSSSHTSGFPGYPGKDGRDGERGEKGEPGN